MELATLWRTDGGYALRGSVVGALGDAALAARYRVECTAAWETRSVWLEVTQPPEVRDIRLEVDAKGRWTVAGAPRSGLDGLVDVDIQVTPATNTLPIQRLSLAVGDEAEVTAVWIQLPDLTVSSLRQDYQRLRS